MRYMSHHFYITPEEYKIAESNEISASLLEQRIRSLAWDKERATSEAPQKKKSRIPKEIRERALQNGIGYQTLRDRIHYRGWDHEKACTQPLQNRSAQAKKAHEASRQYPKEILELVKENGIHYDTFRHRVNESGWDMYKAATTPTMTRTEIGLLTKHKRMPKHFFKKRGAKNVRTR